MTKADFIQAIKKPRPVYVNVRLTESDCWYVQAVKSHLLLTITLNRAPYIKAVEREDGLYVD